MSTNVLPLLTQRAFNRPLLIHPQMADMLYGILDGRIAVQSFATEALPPKPEANRFVGTRAREDGTRRLTRVAGKTGLITIDGSLVNRGAWVGADMCTGLVSYEGIGAQIDEARADAGIENVVLDLNSYGGEAHGMAALAGKIRQLAKTKYVVAVVNDVAASAGYGIASSADEIVVSPTSVVGSIGVVMLHLDRSAEMAAKGVRPTLIHAGAHKVDGHPFAPLPEGVRADMQRDVMAFYDQFLGVVEAGRGKQRLSVKKARETEARTFIGQDAIAAGLADRVASFEEVLADLSRPRSRASSSTSKGSKAMKPENNNEAPTLNAADHQAIAAEVVALMKAEAPAPAPAATAPAPAPAAAPVLSAEEAVRADRERIAAIAALPEAKGKEALATKLAAEGLSVEAAKSTLSLAGGSTPAPDQREHGAEIGASGSQAAKPAADVIQAGWKKAFERL
ncbi:head maturation protease C [Microcystis phage Mae-JY30]